jgi:hypothetical protein
MRTNAACVTGMCDGVRRHLAAMGGKEVATILAEGELIERHVARVIVKPQALEVCFVPTGEASAQAEDHGLDNLASCHSPTTITLPWTAPSFAAVKGIVHAPCAKPAMKPESRDALLTAIAKARRWIDELRLGRIGSFAVDCGINCKLRKSIISPDSPRSSRPAHRNFHHSPPF